MKHLVKYLKPYYKEIIFAILLLIVQAVSNLFLPNLNAKIINEGIAKGDIQYIIHTGGIMLLATLLLAGAAILASYFSSKVVTSYSRDLRRELYYKVLSFSKQDFDRFGTASLVTRNTNDVHQVQMFVLTLLNIMIMAPIMSIGGIIMAIRQDVVLSSSIIIVVPVIALIVFFIMRKTVPLFKTLQKKVDKVNQVLREKLMGIRVIRAFVKDDYEARRFDKANKDLTQTALKVNRIMALGIPLIMLAMNVTSLAITWFGGIRIDSGAMPIGNLTAFLTYVMEILISIMMAMTMFIMLPRAEASAERINEILHTEPSVKEPKSPKIPSERKGVLAFKDVSFQYADAEAPVLSKISFTALPGQTTAIVGSTGSGKSTLVHLIPRFYDVTEGKIEIDGVDIREMPLELVRDMIGLVPQKSYLFSGTIESNLRFGKKDATEEEMWHALEIAQAKNFVSRLPEKLKAPVDQGGTNFSGGQRQRLCIARAIVKRPTIYIFDDSFSALDNKTEAKVREALKDETKDATVIIVAQKVSTVLTADQIVVLSDKGTIAGIGTHQELLKSCEVYQEIVYSQIPKEEAV
ncbi:MAG: ABC transporter ATP-binding protein [Defluviitoga tunisiensis]|uniref:ABC transporter n=1 Tax=Defluviitoga tunisiensis TaxID=1006576 RepID=A0A0C7NTI5_DEFTU|nr:ABC transporter ATP-binding protein [Defluviitoga tunisiensis]MDD3600537.1 ABC transporter ATP-binding protein [Defluviitoga tunisiensis]CEP79072.1 ABC transporter [Defluviitoga tunisiensis]HHV00890.1 ABC transporter ATP-binding protein [Defluviitoga tunisiensis]HOB55193.1 ABC transporter ATP-binding protein [Defluviitoga tunisiensis]HOL86673.1 ABC transporter ATP-binding protein [Defluviitoga tunisiensis]